MTQFISILKFLAFTAGLLLSSASYAIDYVYDDLNRLVQVVYPTGEIIHYTYDVTGNLLSVVQTNQNNADTSNTNEATQ
ncbi:RHS repeat protein [Candidatus Marithioploca araucensis]|uniref:RHS repeat protein n=1 Tax=Candidatus Marithioploca araucensis TaxID=70273 RepID=A0ABT7VR47_9GAMM|nr:RHS repeat protein [Candidatus Marithioploca araucensis]